MPISIALILYGGASAHKLNPYMDGGCKSKHPFSRRNALKCSVDTQGAPRPGPWENFYFLQMILETPRYN